MLIEATPFFFCRKENRALCPVFMLSVERTKEILNDPTITDKDVEKIRDEFRALAEVIFEQWQLERSKNKKLEQ